MSENPSSARQPAPAVDDIPVGDLDALRSAAASCTRCGLYRDATQTVFGDGLPRAQLMLVGEQPGDREDIDGHTFVGPAGRLLDKVLEEVGIDREAAYVTNMVKHFKFKRRGKRRIHQKPNSLEIGACRPWLDAELTTINPRLVVPLGATAAKGLLGSGFRVTRQRGELIEQDGVRFMATVHPSSILRAPDDRRSAAYGDFLDDLRQAKMFIDGE